MRLPLLLALLFAIIPVNLIAESQVSNTPNNTLYISSYDVGLYWTRKVTEGITAKYSKIPNHNVFVEFMDARHPHNANSFDFWEYLKSKYSNSDIKLVIVADNVALDFAIKHRNENFIKDKPIVFCGISNAHEYDLEGLDLHGIIEQDILDRTYQTVKNLCPDIEKVYAISDKTPTGKIYSNDVKDYFKDFKTPQLEIIDTISTNNLDKVISELNKSTKSAIFYLGVRKYPNGDIANDIDIAQKLGSNCKIPIFSSYISSADELTGGLYAYMIDHGEAAANLAIRILEEDTITQRIFKSPTGFIFNYERLREFNLDTTNLHVKYELLNPPINLLNKYRSLIIWITTLIVLLLLIIILLIRYLSIEKKNRLLIEKARDNALQSDKVKSAFLANVSHELRTPLHAISGFSELIALEDVGENAEHYISIIRKNTSVLTNLVNDLLDLSLIDSDEVKLNANHFNIQNLFIELEKSAHQLLESEHKQHLEITNSINKEHTQLFGDQQRINQVMLNFISNAIKYTENGNITFGYELLDAKPEILPEEKNRTQTFLFFVSDTGTGISKEYQHKIFDRFSRDETQYRSQHGGLGLGLNISKTLIKLMGGKIYMKSEVGKGSTFGFILPINDQ